MNKLKKQIIRYFLLFSFLIAVLESIVDSFFDDYVFLVLPENSIKMNMAFGCYIVLSIGIFLVVAVVFYRILSRIITEETKKQINEKNLLYANITHDLKTPITSIMGFARALKDNKVKEEEYEESIHIIYEKAKQTDELINTLFQYSKLETDTYQLQLQTCDISTLVRNLLAESYQEFENRQMQVAIAIPEEPILCEIDSVELSRAINNLLVNAYKHNNPGTEIGVKVEALQWKVKIVIADQGDVIDPSLLEELCKPFICGSESRTNKGGSGLGLAITRKIVAMHQGRLFIDTKIEGYTKGFVIELHR
ncbi:sensor histidine kinase [Anaerosporobacter faecicola]|uniref:sensor histidine kinase n=1 Tax=Anaerosporobacter faecicola TaxID=2718714 RepID=UPI00143B39CD|nr:HAMP domain-containing sensor histidine kinase [Anaerosporobacter faecicola]